MSTRKPHRKSRNGCYNCKKRHMKCGEERPGCRNCFEYDDLHCQYPPRPGLSSSGPSRNSSPNSPPQIGPPTTLSNDPDDLNVADLELLHHFTTSTYKSMSNVPEEQILWQTNIIAVGFQHTFLLRGILALSAAHLVYLKPPQQALPYLVKASTHQNTALPRFRQALSSVTPSTFDAVLAFSYLVPVHSIAMLACSNVQHRQEQEDNLSAALKALGLMRSVNILLLPVLDTFPTGTTMLLPLLKFTEQAEALPEAADFPGREALDLLETACVTFETNTSAEPYRRIQTFRNAIARLKITFARVASPIAAGTFTMGIVLLWIFDVSEEYVVLLGEKHPCALAIWGYFSTLLYGRDLWWLEGLGAGLVDTVSRELGTDWRSVMEWTRRHVGLD